MFKTLAFRNMKRQLRNYLIYFVTIAMTISLVFAINNLIYNEDLQERAEVFASLSTGLLVLSGFLCVVIAVVLGYANAFILRLRKREFGTYLTLGMKRQQIVKLFLLENCFLGLAAMLTGFLFGSLLYQGLMLLMSALLAYDFAFSFVSLKGVVVTLLMVIVIFALTFVASSIHLRRVTIIELIHGEKKVKKVERKPIFSSIVTVISAIGLGYVVYQFPIKLEAVLKGTLGSETDLLLLIALLAVTVTTFHIGLANSLMYILLKRTKLRQKGTNQFILRQLSAALSTNALLLGLLSFLITFSIIAMNTGFLYKAVEEANIERRYPFDLMANETVGEEPAISREQAKASIEQFTAINKAFETTIFTSGEVDFLKVTSWYADFLKDTDAYMKESDLNALLLATNQEPISLQNEYAIYSNMPAITQYDFSKETIEHDGQQYTLSHVVGEIPAYVWAYLVIVVPDELVEGMQPIQRAYAYDLASTDFDVAALNKQLSYIVRHEAYVLEESDYRIKAYEFKQSLSFSAILIVGALYIGFVFILLAMAILALKTLSTISDDEKKYRILDRIGVSKELQVATLAKQVFTFFAFPVIVPMLLTVPVGIISERFIELLGFKEELSMISLSLLIVSVIFVIYLIYFIVTFSIVKKHVLHTER